MDTLLRNMRFLCDESRMLSSISVAYGTADRWEGAAWGRSQELPESRPPAEEPICDLASLTKLFTCLTLLRLSEEGRLSLDEPFGAVDKRFRALRDCRLFDLLSFRTALRTDGRIDEAPSREEGLRRLFATAPCEPARIRIYSDINAMVLKYAVEQRSGLPFFEAVKKYVLDPAGMTETFAHVPEAMRGRCLSYNYEYRIAKDRYILRSDILPGIANDPKASLLSEDGKDLCGHAGLFSTRKDMIRLAQALLSGRIVRPETLRAIGIDRTGIDYGDGTYRQYLGFLCFSRHPLQRLSEVPAWMTDGSFGLSGFTGNHLSIDPNGGHFVLFLGNRCHGRVSHIDMPEGRTLSDYGLDERGVGMVPWPDGSRIPSSCRYVFFKDERLHAPIRDRMRQLGWLSQ